ncbi:MAG TPA: hypothetical protein VF600_00800 [Abditibacteriaceae bacterium]|jgi:prepilin-type processing-associated H-X9-DG protein
MKTFWQRRKWDVLGATLALVVGGGLIGWNRLVLQPERICMSQLRQTGRAMYQYIRDYDEKYPLTPNWVQATRPYAGGGASLQCPSRTDLPVGYAMHSGVARLHDISWLNTPQRSIFVFDSDAGGANPIDDGKHLPTSPRHPRGHAVLFHDGHVESVLQPDFAFGYDERVLKPIRELVLKQQAEYWRKMREKEKAAARAKQLSTKAQTR